VLDPPNGVAFLEALGAELFWLVALTALAALVWRAGLRKTLRNGV
jgi:ABC-type uncharacterized transport system permease subunit